MKTFQILALFIFITLSSPAYAAQTVTVGVNGMVCDFCARALEKVFSKKEGVESISVNLDEKTVIVNLKDETAISDEELTRLINDSGYDVRTISRTDTGIEDSDEEASDGPAS